MRVTLSYLLLSILRSTNYANPICRITGSTVYTVTIKGGTSGVKDLAGNALVNDYSWTFTTVAVDITPPTVTISISC